MREIKFRGRSVFDGSWVYGYLRVRDGVPHAIIESPRGLGYNVYTDTVGQYTGLKDKNGKEIYEDDLVKSNKGIIYRVFYDTGNAAYLVSCRNNWANKEAKPVLIHRLDWLIRRDAVVVGSIYENPELLGGNH